MRQFYLLFQQHSTPDRAKDHGMFGGTGFSQLVMLGPSVAVALPDQRAERTTRQVGLHAASQFMSVSLMPLTCQYQSLGACTWIVITVQPRAVFMYQPMGHWCLYSDKLVTPRYSLVIVLPAWCGSASIAAGYQLMHCLSTSCSLTPTHLCYVYHCPADHVC